MTGWLPSFQGRLGARQENALPSRFSAGQDPAPIKVENTDMDTKEVIRKQVTENPVVLYMKGTPEAPMCGFSAAAVQILEACGAENVATVNVLEDPEIRQGIKDYSNWPTIPQLYVKGEFVGGADIIREMYQSGELQKLLAK
jgi:monothiol glutaredoxin